MTPGCRLLLVGMISACTVLAQNAETRVAGVVLDSATSQPVPGVVIEIGTDQTITDSQGRFELNDLPSGSLHLLGTKDGYLSARLVGDSGGGVRLTLAPGQVVSDLVLELPPAGVVTGQVYDSQGRPLRRAVVVPYRLAYDSRGREVFRAVSGSSPARSFLLMGLLGLPSVSISEAEESRVVAGRTDDRGEFRIFNLEPGQYRVFIEPELPNVGVFHPGAQDPTRATVVDVRGGAETRLAPTTLPPSGQSRLRVRIINQLGTYASGSLFLRRPGNPENIAVVASVQDGQWTDFGYLPTGSYVVEGLLGIPLGRPFLAASQVTVDLFGSEVDQEIPVSAGVPLRGEAYHEPSLAAVPGLILMLQSENTLTGIDLPVISRPDGTFGVDSIPPGLFHVASVTGVPPGMCLESVFHGDRNVLRDGLIVATNEVELRAVLTDSQVSAMGAVLTDEALPVPNAVVALIPENSEQTDLYRQVVADQNGRFELACVMPGTYQLYAWRGVEENAWRNSGFMATYVGQGLPLFIDSDAIENLTVQVN